MTTLNTVIVPAQEAFPVDTRLRSTATHRWIEAKPDRPKRGLSPLSENPLMVGTDQAVELEESMKTYGRVRFTVAARMRAADASPTAKRGGLVPGRLRARVALSVVLAVFFATDGLATFASSASAAPAWSIVASPNALGPPSGELQAVSCPSVTSCFAVGHSFNGSTYSTLVERWNGTAWSIVASPNRVGASQSSLAGVSCTTTTSCFAVGTSGSSTLVERWNGTAWSIVASPNGASQSSLAGVSCTTTTSCFAVGYSDGSTLVERWNGTAWSIVASPNPAGAFNMLAGVSCTTSASCFAVGVSVIGLFNSTSSTLVERWNGTAWSIVASPNPGQSRLAGVSCTTSTSCFAVGTSTNGSTTLVERWNGTAWSIVASPNRIGAQTSSLAGVSCTSSASCFAAGYSFNGSTVSTLVERWNGTAWSIVASPNRVGAQFNSLAGVSCTTSTSCFAAGNSSPDATYSTLSTLVERWNGTAWSIVASPNRVSAQTSSLAGVSCTTSTSCFAVGASSFNGSTVSTLVERWNGTAWSLVASPNPVGASWSSLAGVSCTTTTSCFAVGYSVNGSTISTLVERWNGTAWSIVASPHPVGASQSSLAGVSCTTTTSCFAVGTSTNGSTNGTLVERWNGTSWSVTPSPNQGTSSSNNFLSGVSCTSSTSCVAVGHYDNATLVERWNGTSWSVTPSPNPGSYSNGLTGVSCTSSTSCVAVGSYQNASGAYLTLVETWNGTSWSVTPSPNPNYSNSLLTGVSCTSSTSCVAVGSYRSYYGSNIDRTLVETWNGTSWSITPSPNRGTSANVLQGVSCSSTSCVAVGSYHNTSGLDLTLIETGS